MDSIKCPKCGYYRKSSDDAPAWQCPSCKIAYSKYPGYQNAPQYKTYSDKRNKYILPKKKNSKLILTLLFCIIAMEIYFLIPNFKKKNTSNPTRPPLVININGNKINLNQLTDESNKALISLNQCLSICNQNSDSAKICLNVNEFLSKNNSKLSLLRNYYNSGLVTYNSDLDERRALEKIKKNLIKIIKKTQDVASTCKRFNYIKPSELTFKMPQIDFQMMEKKIPKRIWLKENKDLFSIATCNSIMDNKLWKNRLKKETINLDKCISSIMPQLFDYCTKVNDYVFPLYIDKTNVQITSEIIIGCLVGSLAQRYFFNKSK